MLRTDFPQPTFFDRPRKVRAHQAIWLAAIDGELFAVSVGQAVFVRALQNKLSGLIEFRSCRHSMQPSQIAKVLVRSGAVRLIAKLGPLMNVEKRLLPKSEEGGASNDADQSRAAHKLMRIALWMSRSAPWVVVQFNDEILNHQGHEGSRRLLASDISFVYPSFGGLG
jgi:hypothetical protein